MILNIDYPAKTIEKKVKNIKFIFDSNTAMVELLGEHPEMITIDLKDKVLTGVELTTIRDFFAQIIADAAGIQIKNIPKEEIMKKEIESK